MNPITFGLLYGAIHQGSESTVTATGDPRNANFLLKCLRIRSIWFHWVLYFSKYSCSAFFSYFLWCTSGWFPSFIKWIEFPLLLLSLIGNESTHHSSGKANRGSPSGQLIDGEDSGSGPSSPKATISSAWPLTANGVQLASVQTNLDRRLLSYIRYPPHYTSYRHCKEEMYIARYSPVSE